MVECRQIKPHEKQTATQNNGNIANKRANWLKRGKARENAGYKVAIGYHWNLIGLKSGASFFGPIIEQSEANPDQFRITVDVWSKFALSRFQNAPSCLPYNSYYTNWENLIQNHPPPCTLSGSSDSSPVIFFPPRYTTGWNVALYCDSKDDKGCFRIHIVDAIKEEDTKLLVLQLSFICGHSWKLHRQFFCIYSPLKFKGK